MTSTGTAMILSAPSGTGKTSVCDYLREHHPEIRFSVSHTTREPRPGEVEGRNYFFVTREEFNVKVRNNDFLEWAEIHGQDRYGTDRQQVDAVTAQGHDIILELDVQGVVSLKKLAYPGVYVFLLPPSMQELERRLRERGTESESKIQTRLNTGRKEIAQYKMYDHLLTNHDIAQTAEALVSIFRNANSSTGPFETSCPEIRQIMKENG